MRVVDFSTARISVGSLDFQQFIADDLHQTFSTGKDVAQILNLEQQFLIFSNDLVLLQPGEAVQPQIKNGLSLSLRHAIPLAMQTIFGRQAIRPGRNGAGTLQHGGHCATRPVTAQQADLCFSWSR